jgi:surfeit locus 1 family protein
MMPRRMTDDRRRQNAVVSDGSPPETAARILARPSMLALHLLALVAIVGCVVAGVWQLGVYQSEQDDERDARAAAAPASLTTMLGPDEGITNALVGAPVFAEGQYAPAAQQILIADRRHAGRDGYWVVSPLLLETGSAILVVRGWTPEQSAPPVPSAPVTVTGSLRPGEEPGADSVLGSDRVVDTIRTPSLVGQLPYDLYSAVLIRTAEEPRPSDGLVPVDPSAPDVPWTDGLRNLAYALQWWVFGAFAVFMWWRICVDQVARRRSPPAEQPSDAGSLTR